MSIDAQVKQCGQTRYVEVTVTEQDLQALKKIIPQILVGDDKNPRDGLLDQINLEGNDKGKLSGLTRAAARWVQSNSTLNSQLSSYYLQPKVKECKSTAGAGVCEAATIASPDLPLNLQKIAGQLSSATTTSFTYYIYNQARPMCAYFGLHQGLVAFSTAPICR